MSRVADLQNRRTFLKKSLAAASALGMGAFCGGRLLADRTDVAFKLDDLPQSHPLIPALQFGAESLSALNKVTDYTATFQKKEMVDRKLIDTRMELKLREQPFSVYLKFLQPHTGREVIYVEGQNNGYLSVHDVGFASLAGTISLDPTGSYAMDENRYPVTKIGMKNLVSTLMQQWIAETKLDGVSVTPHPETRIGQIVCKGVEAAYREPRAGAKFQTARLYVDRQTGLPVRLQAHDFPGRRDKQAPLVEDYLYSDMAVNVGLTDLDFSTKNPKYGF